jgi:hypothetical protein
MSGFGVCGGLEGAELGLLKWWLVGTWGWEWLAW